MTHDELIDRMFAEYQRADHKRYVGLFLSGLSENKIYLGMAALGYMRNFPKHKYCLLEAWVKGKGQKAILQQQKLKVLDRKVLYYDDLPPDWQSNVVKNFTNGICYCCEICSGFYNSEYPISDDMKKYWLDYGSLHCSNELFLFWMEYTNSLTSIPEPTKDDFEILQSIMTCVCSALAPFYEFDNIPMEDRSSPRSNWQPPVDFWRGKNRIDENAFMYWFGSQPYKFNINNYNV